MAQRSMFFDAVSGDRSYDAASLAALLRALVQRDGVVYGYGGNLAVSATDPASMNVTVATGAAFVQGRMFEVHTAGETLAIGPADPVNPRIDRIVVKLDNSSAVRSVRLAVKAGTPAASPTPPTLQRDGTVWELSLAQVYVAAGATSISSANITDERSNEAVCGRNLGAGIIEMGSNANGEYVRWENGLQVCFTGTANVVISTSPGYAEYTFTLPAAYLNANYLAVATIHAVSLGNDFTCSLQSVRSVGSVLVRLYTTLAQTYAIAVLTIGRWK